MTEDEAKQVLRAHGWTPRTRRLPRTVKWYLYGYRKKQGKTEEKYIAPIHDLEHMTESQIVRKLQS